MNLKYMLLTLAYCAGIFAMSSSSNPVDLPQTIPNMDKIVHACLFGGLAAIVSFGIRRSGRRVSNIEQFVVPLLFSTLYGVSDEIHQVFVPGRHADVLDVAADMTGAFVVQIVLCNYVWAIWREERPAER